MVVKAEHAELAHRARAGGVRVGVIGDDALRAALADIRARVLERAGLEVQDFEVQALQPPGVEWIISTVVDREVGRVVSIGTGGALVEIYADLVHGVPTLDRARLRQRILRTRLGAGLSSSGLLPTDGLESLLDAYAVISSMAMRMAADAETGTLEINPLIMDLRTGRVCAVDALWVADDNSHGEGAVA